VADPSISARSPRRFTRLADAARPRRAPLGRLGVAVASVVAVAALAGVAVAGALAPGGSAPGATTSYDGRAGRGAPANTAAQAGLISHAAPTPSSSASVADPLALFHQWHASLSDAERFAFALFALDDDGRAAVDAFFNPPPPPPEPPVAAGGSVWDALAQCESSGNWSMNSGNGFHGGLQFMHSTWVNMGGRQWAEYPHDATRNQQIEVATRLQAAYGWGQWPACSARLGLR